LTQNASFENLDLSLKKLIPWFWSYWAEKSRVWNT